MMNAVLSSIESTLVKNTPSGIPHVGELPWGTHFCHLYETRQDLIDIVVPYLLAGLANHEKCIWITSSPLLATDARAVLASHLPDIADYIERKQIQIADHAEWYSHLGDNNSSTVLNGWLREEQKALEEGYSGLRVNGNISFVKTHEEWQSFGEYDSKVSETISGRHVLGLCSFDLKAANGGDIFDVINGHDFAVAQRAGQWNVIENARLRSTKQELNDANVQLEQRVIERTSDLKNALEELQRQKLELESVLRIKEEVQTQLQSELEDAKLIHKISSTLSDQGDLDNLYQTLVSVAAFVMRSQYATIQRLDQQLGSLIIIANHNFDADALEYWGCVPAKRPTSCGIALHQGERCIVNDYETWDHSSHSDDLAAFRKGGVRAAQSTPLFSRDGTLIGMISTHWTHAHTPSERDLRMLDVIARQAADLIEHRMSSEELREKADQLADANNRKDLFLATLAHELRNPLAPLQNGLSVLQLSKSDTTSVIQMMQRQLLHMVRLIDELLDVSRVSRGLVTLKKERFELRTAIDSAIETSRPLFEASRHVLTVKPNGQAIWVNADYTRIAQILSNILNNAAKYTPAGGQILLDLEADETTVTVRIADNGIGISKEMLTKIFDLFTRADDAAERNQGGLGIGLSLAKQLTELHGGTISVRSSGPNMGTTFTVKLPTCTTLAEHQAMLAGENPSSDNISRILVVDDNVDAAETLAMLFTALNYETLVVNDSRTAIDAALEFRPDVVFLDLGMPFLNGFDLARQFRNHVTLQATNLVALSGWGAEADRKRSKEAGIDHHLTKPVMLNDVQRVLTLVTEAA